MNELYQPPNLLCLYKEIFILFFHLTLLCFKLINFGGLYKICYAE